MGQAISDSIASTTGEVTSILTTNLPTVLSILGGLIALGLVIRYVYKFIGRRA